MDELQKYLDILFANYGHSTAAMELKAGLLVKLRARMEMLLAGGLTEDEALAKVKSAVTDIGPLIEGNCLVYVSRFRHDCLLTALFYAIVTWIFSMPLIVLLDWAGMVIAALLMLTAGAAAWAFIRNSGPTSAELSFLNANLYQQRKRSVWRWWLVAMLAVMLAISLFSFGKDTPLPSGAWAWATLLARYYAPLLTVALPLYISHIERLMHKNEAGQEEL